MPVTEALQADGEWTLTLDADAPGWVRDLLNLPYSLLYLYPSRPALDSVFNPNGGTPTGATPLYLGVLLTRPDELSGRGAGPSWLLGRPATSSYQWGPCYTGGFSETSGTAAKWIGDMFAFAQNSLKAGSVDPSLTATLTLTFPAMTPRAMLGLLGPYFGAEFRANPNLTVDFGTWQWLYPNYAIVDKHQAGRDPAHQGLQPAQLGYMVDWSNRANRVILDYTGGSYDTTRNADGYCAPDGSQLQLTYIYTDTQQTSTSAGPTGLTKLAQMLPAAATINVTVTDETVTDGLLTCGSLCYIYAPDDGIYNTGQQMVFRGATIYPQAVRCVGIQWPITTGMGVFLDNRHQGGTLVDVSDYVAYESASTTLTVGTVPYLLGLRSLGANLS